MKTVTPAARRLIPVPLIVWSDLRSIDAIAWSTEIRQAETEAASKAITIELPRAIPLSSRSW